ncbi:MAG: hypothetical protein O7C58_01305 [Rickettsia endosymbiont of Ixodes persulcatus]|nr:hypothetical protein [Rickettsia endosymbiont of Ixodes persulcatus]
MAGMLVAKLDPEKYEIVIFGDFNVPGTWWELQDTSNVPSKASHLVNFISFNGFGLGDLPANAMFRELGFQYGRDACCRVTEEKVPTRSTP